MAPAFLLAVAVQALAGCGSSPTQPDVVPPPLIIRPGGPVVVPGQIRGTVQDSAIRPLAGAVVEVLDGPQAGATATTDAEGVFVLMATVDASTRFGITKDGYVTAIRPPGFCEVCSPLKLFYIFVLESRTPSVNLAGNYTLTFIADSACTGIPIALRTRTYAVTIARVPDSFYPAGTFFAATAQGVPYWEDRNSIPIATAGNFVKFILTEDGSPYFVEEVAPGVYVDFNALPEFSVDAELTTISTSFRGLAEYWGPAVANPVHCDSNHQMTLTRR